MEKRLEGKIAIVTAGGSGIGKFISAELIKAGCNVVIAARDIERLNRSVYEFEVMGGKALAVRTDISKEEDVIRMVKSAVDAFGKIDILVNNTGVAGPINNLVDMDLTAWNDALAVDLTGTMLVTREVLKYMIPQGTGGSIINIGAEASRIADGWGGYPTRAAYMACKAGVRAMQAAVAVEVGKFKIRINTLSPAAVRSERMIQVMKKYAEEKQITLEEQIRIEESNYSLKRITEPDDIAKCVIFLASDDSFAITNQTIACSSGMCLMASQV